MNLDNKEAENYWVRLITLTKDETIQPSSLLSNIVWVKFVIDFLDLKRTAATSSKVSDSDKQKSDLLLIKLCEKFKVHVKKRLKQAAKQNHWILEFAFKNLSVIAATMILSNHRKIKLKCLSEIACLLACNSNQLIPSQEFLRREGVYLYFDFNQGVFARSGKVVRHSFQVRHSKHLVASKEKSHQLTTFISCIHPLKERKETRQEGQVGMLRASDSGHRSWIQSNIGTCNASQQGLQRR